MNRRHKGSLCLYKALGRRLAGLGSRDIFLRLCYNTEPEAKEVLTFWSNPSLGCDKGSRRCHEYSSTVDEFSRTLDEYSPGRDIVSGCCNRRWGPGTECRILGRITSGRPRAGRR